MLLSTGGLDGLAALAAAVQQQRAHYTAPPADERLAALDLLGDQPLVDKRPLEDGQPPPEAKHPRAPKALPPKALPPGWTVQRRKAVARSYNVFHGPNGERAVSIADAWRKDQGIPLSPPAPRPPPPPAVASGAGREREPGDGGEPPRKRRSGGRGGTRSGGGVVWEECTEVGKPPPRAASASAATSVRAALSVSGGGGVSLTLRVCCASPKAL